MSPLWRKAARGVRDDRINMRGFFLPAVAVFCLFFWTPLTSHAVLLDKVVAVVNHDAITLSELKEEMIQESIQQSPEGEKRALESLIEKKLIETEVQKLGISVSEEEVDEAVQDVMRKHALSDEGLDSNLRAQGLTLKSYREKLRVQIERAKLINKELRHKVTISDEDLRGYYQKRKVLFSRPEEVRLMHILLKFPPGSDAGKKNALRAKAEDILKQVRSGKDFSRLARVYSEDNVTSSSGGDLGFIRRGELQANFERAAFSLKPGQASIVDMSYGYHIIKVVEKRSPRPVPFEEVADQVREALFQEKADTIFRNWVEELKEKSVIEVKL